MFLRIKNSKKIIAAAALLALIGNFGYILQAQAAPSCGMIGIGCCLPADNSTGGKSFCVETGSQCSLGLCVPGTGNGSPPPGGYGKIGGPAAPPSAQDVGEYWFENWVLKYVALGFGLLGAIVAQIIAWLEGVIAKFYNLIVQYNLNFSTNISVIKIGWTLSRDIANMFFILILLFIAITTMLRVSGYDTKVLLRKLIVIALLINFSLAGGLMIIDATNVLGNEFYNNMTNNGQSPIADKILAGSGITKIFELGKAKGLTDTDTSSLTQAIAYAKITWSNAVVLSIMLFVLFFAAILLLIRVAVLAFLLVVMPLAFVASILPKTESMWDKWWSTFLNHAFFFPANLFMIWFSVKFISNISATFLNASSNGSQNMLENPAIFTGYLIACVMLIGSLLIAKHMSFFGASTVIGWAKGSSKYVGASITSRTVGAVGQRIQAAAPNSYAANRIAATMMGMGAKGLGGSRTQQNKDRSEFQLASTMKKSMPEQLKDLKEIKHAASQKQIANSILKDDKKLAQAIKTGDNEGIQVLKRIAREEQGEDGVKKIDKEIRKQTRQEIQATGKMTMGQFVDSLNDEQAQAHIKDMSPREQGDLEAEWQGDSVKLMKLQSIVSRLDPEEQIKFNEAAGRSLTRDLDKLAPNLHNLPEAVQKLVVGALSDLDIQKLAGNKNTSVDALYKLVQKIQPNKKSVLESTMPKIALSIGGKDEEIIPTVNMGTVAKTNLPSWDKVALHSRVKQMNSALDRSDLAKDLLDEYQKMYVAAGKDMVAFAKKFEDNQNASMAKFIRTQKSDKVKQTLNLT